MDDTRECSINLTDLCLRLVTFWSWTWRVILYTSCAVISVCMRVLMSSRAESPTVLCCLWVSICICMYSVLSFINPQSGAFGFKWCFSSDTSTQVKVQKQPVSTLTKIGVMNLSIATNYFPWEKTIERVSLNIF